MRHRAVILLGVVLVLAGCAHRGAPPPVGFGPGTSVHTITVGGTARTYRLYQPEGLPATAPLVVMLHGGFGSARQAEKSYEWDDLADSEKFVVAYPDGLNRAWNTNGGGCCGRPARDGVDDTAFISAAVADVEQNTRIDRSRIFATGMSNGAIMAYTLACNTGLFAAIGPVSGTQLDPCLSPHPTSVMHIHGTGDPLVPYSGGPGAGIARINGPPVEQLNTFWRNVDHCTAPSATTSGFITTLSAGCADRRSVVLVTVGDGGHQWPSVATEMLWQFFAQHPG
ncbi:alpha/beta hydrolase family esterase [Mycobacterium kubicae]|uniref:extracellular catalytic domain type 1 short-chain-length polyhydroxyalkanoate depolymerase n=1 Tax=Mycobacterium kubicae TaxID=120959 RepID=UPI0007FC75DE|nr:PHB depolymerase family esterase [Mycobacterium kubicae]OBK56611.1 polyhydroxybutyrate depolymerase [Mycobacterium kubicae]